MKRALWQLAALCAVLLSLPAAADDLDVWKTDMATVLYIETHLDMPDHSCNLGEYTRYYEGWTLKANPMVGETLGKTIHGWYLLGGDKQVHLGEIPEKDRPPTDQGCRVVFVLYNLETRKIKAQCDFSFRPPTCPLPK